MPDQVVILFMFAVITSFGIIWVANEMRLNKLSLGVSAAVLLFTVWSVKSYYDGGDIGQVQNSIIGLGITALTPREADILKKIIRGASNKEIAEQSFISPHTVRNHIYNIYQKTGIKNRFQLLALFQED